MPDPTRLRLLRNRSASTSSLPRSQLTLISGFPGNRSTSTSGFLLNDGPQYQPAVKITMWRFLNTLFILIVGTLKMFSALHGQPVSPDILDWTIGVIWALVYVQLYILTMILCWKSITDRIGLRYLKQKARTLYHGYSFNPLVCALFAESLQPPLLFYS